MRLQTLSMSAKFVNNCQLNKIIKKLSVGSEFLNSIYEEPKSRLLIGRLH